MDIIPSLVSTIPRFALVNFAVSDTSFIFLQDFISLSMIVLRQHNLRVRNIIFSQVKTQLVLETKKSIDGHSEGPHWGSANIHHLTHEDGTSLCVATPRGLFWGQGQPAFTILFLKDHQRTLKDYQYLWHSLTKECPGVWQTPVNLRKEFLKTRDRNWHASWAVLVLYALIQPSLHFYLLFNTQLNRVSCMCMMTMRYCM